MDINKEIIKNLISEKAEKRKDLERIKKNVAKKYGLPFPTNMDLLQAYHKKKIKDEKILALLRTRPVRSLSGVVNISVLTKPFNCPGKCIYCPSEKNMPKSYLKNEPAVMRAVLNKYHPLKQIQMRIRALEKTGHPTEKIELRIVGGTWSFYPKKYQHWFIKKCFDSCNNSTSKTLKEAQRKNRKSKHRIVCLSVETRPDFITKEEIKRLRSYGVTMVELGIQSTLNEILNFTQRGHTKKETIKATELLKNAGFKICYQVMLNLPGGDLESDKKTFLEIFRNPSYRPDFLKIYPCLVIENTPLYSLWKRGKHQIFSDSDLVELITDIKKNIIPSYVRIQRLFRDIPVQNISAGCKISNLREVIKKKEKEEGWKCKCIRCREVKENYNPKEKIFLYRKNYNASGGKEVFLSLENKKRNKLYAFLRLRVTEKTTLPVLKDSTIIREIKTYGQHVLVGEKSSYSPQHQGFGKKLIKEAEKITKKEFNVNKVAVISGVGVRDYWRKLGYKLKNTYMLKEL